MPRCLRALGRAPATSARPPVLRKGATSEATNRILSGIRAGLEGGAGAMTAGQLHHPLAGDVDVAPGPAVALVEPLLAIALEPPRRGAGSGHLVGGVAIEVVARGDGLEHALVELELAVEVAQEDRPL